LLLRVALRQRQSGHLHKVVVFGGQPEEDGRRNAALFVLAFELQHAGEFGERVDRAAGETDLLTGDDREGLAAGPAQDFVADVAAPFTVRADQSARQGGRPRDRAETPRFVSSKKLRSAGVASHPIEREWVQA